MIEKRDVVMVKENLLLAPLFFKVRYFQSVSNKPNSCIPSSNDPLKEEEKEKGVKSDRKQRL